MSKFYTHAINRKNRILVCGYDNGRRFKEQVHYRPYLFTPASAGKKTDYQTIHGQYVVKKEFESSSAMRQYRQQYEDVDGYEIYGLEQPQYLYLYDHFNHQKYDPKLIVTNSIDIEVDTENGYPNLEIADKEINAITMVYKDVTFAFGLKDYDSSLEEDNEDVKYFKCRDEEDLLIKFMKVWESEKFRPDVVTGWNIEFFDIPYIVMRLIRLFGEDFAKRLSPWGILESKDVFTFGRMQKVFFPLGVNVLDYMALYKKFVAVTKPQESYRLDHIAFVELGARKLDYSKYGSLNQLYIQNPQKYMAYNIRDSKLVMMIDDKHRLLELVYKIAFDSGVNMPDALGTVKAWDVAIHNYLLDRNIVVPKNKIIKTHSPVGGYVKAPIVGMHQWVVSFDLASLYPHLIMQYNIGPDTFVKQLGESYTAEQLMDCEHDELFEYLDKNQLAFAANSTVYTKDKTSFFSELMKTLFNERKEIKKRMLELKSKKEAGDNSHDDEIAMLDTIQYSLKVRLNSVYGAMSNEFFRWYDVRHAEAITMGGQLTIKWAERKMNEFMNDYLSTTGIDYVIASDTDSIYVNMHPIIKATGDITKREDEYLDWFCDKEVQPYLDKIFQELADNMRAKEQAMYMKREAIADRGVFIAKKRYMLNVLNNEGVQYDQPDVKIMGLESVRSSTPSACRVSIKEAFRIVLQESESDLQSFVSDFRKRFNEMSFDEIAKNSSVNGMDKYGSNETIYRKGCPMHVRGALLYNHLIKAKKLDREPIYEGDKIKFCYLNIPNPIHENIIAVAHGLPTELGLDDYLDRDTQFEKTFLEPVNAILSVINWTHEPVNSVMSFFE